MISKTDQSLTSKGLHSLGGAMGREQTSKRADEINSDLASAMKELTGYDKRVLEKGG